MKGSTTVCIIILLGSKILGTNVLELQFVYVGKP